VQDPIESFEDQADMVLLPENSGDMYALRELHYPGNILPPIVYESNPDYTDNFDTIPLTGPPQYKSDQTLAAALMTQWPGYMQDNPVREYWEGTALAAGDSSAGAYSRMGTYFFRRLWEYFANPPASGTYITWWPKDKTTQGYYVVLEALTVGGKDIQLDSYGVAAGMVLGEVILSMRLMGPVPLPATTTSTTATSSTTTV
jgi:hypothetical protein